MTPESQMITSYKTREEGNVANLEKWIYFFNIYLISRYFFTLVICTANILAQPLLLYNIYGRINLTGSHLHDCWKDIISFWKIISQLRLFLNQMFFLPLSRLFWQSSNVHPMLGFEFGQNWIIQPKLGFWSNFGCYQPELDIYFIIPAPVDKNLIEKKLPILRSSQKYSVYDKIGLPNWLCL